MLNETFIKKMKSVFRTAALLALCLNICLCAYALPVRDVAKAQTPAAGANASDTVDIKTVFPEPKSEDEPGLMHPVGTYGDVFGTMKKTKLVLPTGYEDLSEAILELRDMGLDLLSGDLALQAGYALTMAESYATSVRYACDVVLESRGVTFENIGLFSDWNQIKHISLASTMPYLLQAVCAESGGDSTEELMSWYEKMGTEAPGEEKLRKLYEASDEELKALREALAEFECEIYTFYPIVPEDEELTGYEPLTGYHLLVAETYMELGLYQRALKSYQNAVHTNPFDATLIGDTAWCAVCAGDVETALEYIDNGLLLEPGHAGINLLAALYFAGAGDTDAAASYLRTAREAGLTENQEAIAQKIEASEGGD